MAYCRALASLAAFFFLVCFVISIVSTALPNWWTVAGAGAQGGWATYLAFGLANPNTQTGLAQANLAPFTKTQFGPGQPELVGAVGLQEGLWQSCLYSNCYPTNQYGGGCQGLLNVVRAFSIMTIIFGFFAFVASVALVFYSPGAAGWAIALGVLTVLSRRACFLAERPPAYESEPVNYVLALGIRFELLNLRPAFFHWPWGP